MTKPSFRPDHRPQLIRILDEWYDEVKWLSNTDRMLNHTCAQLLIENEKAFPNSVVSLIMHRFAWGCVRINELSLLPKLTNVKPWKPEQQGRVYELCGAYMWWYLNDKIS